MIVRISPIFCLVLALVATSDASNEADDDDDTNVINVVNNDVDPVDIAADANKFDISFKVNRLMHDDNDDNDDDDDDDSDDSGDKKEEADPEWSELWNYGKKEDIPPVYVIILGG